MQTHFTEKSNYPLKGLQGNSLYVFNNDRKIDLIINVKKLGGGGYSSQYKIKVGDRLSEETFFDEIKVLHPSRSFNIFVVEG